MNAYLYNRILWISPMVVGLILISFFIMHLAPGDITSSEASFNPKASEESRQKLRELYNLDKPVIVQYGLWLKRIVSLDFGNSFASHQRPVLWQTKDKNGNIIKGLIQESLPITLLINLIGIFLIFSITVFNLSFYNNVFTLMTLTLYNFSILFLIKVFDAFLETLNVILFRALKLVLFSVITGDKIISYAKV